MASVHLVFVPPLDPTAPPDAPPPADGTIPLRASQRADRFGAHTLTEDPASADLILFVRTLGHDGAVFFRLLAHPLVRRYRAKCFLYDLNDLIVPVLPGIYPSVERRWHDRTRTRSGPYLEETANPFLVYDPAFTARQYLYSFLGAVRSAPMRERLAALPHDARGLFLDTSARAEQIARHGTADEKREFARQYADATNLSRFVLCPRGVGVSSRRLFETMSMGRAPVVLADDWVPPDGPAWERSCVFIKETDCTRLPQILAEREPEAGAMGREGRLQWEEWYAPEVLFHRTVESCLSITRERRRLPEPVASWLAYTQNLRPTLLRHWARQTGFNQRVKKRLRGLGRPGK